MTTTAAFWNHCVVAPIINARPGVAAGMVSVCAVRTGALARLDRRGQKRLIKNAFETGQAAQRARAKTKAVR